MRSGRAQGGRTVSFFLGALLGFTLGWLIEWVIDKVFWRMDDTALLEELHRAKTEVQDLQAELTESRKRLAVMEKELARFRLTKQLPGD